jgi:hypothetical protein
MNSRTCDELPSSRFIRTSGVAFPVDDRRVHFLPDRGIADPDEFRVKSHLCHEIATIVDPH